MKNDISEEEKFGILENELRESIENYIRMSGGDDDTWVAGTVYELLASTKTVHVFDAITHFEVDMRSLLLLLANPIVAALADEDFAPKIHSLIGFFSELSGEGCKTELQLEELKYASYDADYYIRKKLEWDIKTKMYKLKQMPKHDQLAILNSIIPSPTPAA